MLLLLMLSATGPPAALLTQRTDKKMNSEKINCIVIIKRANTANNEIIKYAELWLLFLAKCADVKIRLLLGESLNEDRACMKELEVNPTFFSLNVAVHKF